MKETLIIAGGEISPEFAQDYCKNKAFDCYIAADNGLSVMHSMKITPNYIVGDFDTVSPLLLSQYEQREDIAIRRFRPEKDFTDMQAAVRIAIEEGSASIHILGGTGSRLDHTIANILLLQMASDKGIEAVLAGEHNQIRLLGKTCRSIILQRGDYKYVSLIPLSPVVTDITMTGMKYNIEHYDMYMDREISRGVSNEISDEEGRITIGEGRLLVIESKG